MKQLPVIRVENWLLYPGGKTKKISRLNQLLFKLKIRKKVKLI